MRRPPAAQAAPAQFFVLVFASSTPFWLLGFNRKKLLPDRIPVNLPISAITVICPASVAILLTQRQGGWPAVWHLLTRVLDLQRIKRPLWYLPLLGLMPLISLLSYAILRLRRVALPDPHIPLAKLPLLGGLFVLGAISEELGWQAYAAEPLEQRYGALGSALIVGSVWAIWHAIPYLQARNNRSWIAWQAANSVALRVLLAWLYNNTGKSLFAAITFHTTINLSAFTFPNYGSHYDPLVTSLLTATAATMVTLVCGPHTLAGSQEGLPG